jgi:3-dehydroquinate synthase
MFQLVKLKDYTIYIGNIWEALQNFLTEKKYSKIFVLTDENTEKYCFPLLQEALSSEKMHLISVSSGELNKNIRTCEAIWQQLMRAGADRKSVLINLGGGVIGDMGGFCAGTYYRGIAFIQIPTTLLSQVDSSIGGKLGIDFDAVKNSVGIFRNPAAVFITSDFLQTLSEREVRSGFAEMIKHALICSGAQWKTLSQIEHFKNVDWAAHITPSLLIKKRVVVKDPFEMNVRKSLNFGHTVGHAVESFFLEKENALLHGEAIAIGMVCEAYLAHQKTGLSTTDLDKITQFFLKTYKKQLLPTENFPEMIAIMTKDKKNEGATINCTLLKKIGNFVINCTVTKEEVIESLYFYNQYTL